MVRNTMVLTVAQELLNTVDLTCSFLDEKGIRSGESVLSVKGFRMPCCTSAVRIPYLHLLHINTVILLYLFCKLLFTVINPQIHLRFYKA